MNVIEEVELRLRLNELSELVGYVPPEVRSLVKTLAMLNDETKNTALEFLRREVA